MSLLCRWLPLAELVGLESNVDDIAELIDSYGPGWELHEPGTEPVQEP
jgi:hypothetical protein